MSRYGVCYTATAGYLFSTVVSALQARSHTDSSVGVYIIMISDDDESKEEQLFRRVCAENGVTLISAELSTLRGNHPTFARLYLDEFLPAEVEEILYLDGDTQVVGDINPLVHAETPLEGAVGVRDPMVFIRRSSASFRKKIDGWWDSSGLPAHVRDTYINAGVFRVSRSYLPALRAATIDRFGDRVADFKFLDQDVINLALDGRISVVSMGWNYPGFLLGTQLEDLAPPKIIHFMSNPRPWNAPLRPWGERYYSPYREFVNRYPETEPFWPRLSSIERVRYGLQQLVKSLIERPRWQSRAAKLSVRELESGTRSIV